MGLLWDRLTKPIGEPPYKPLPDYHIRVLKIKPGTSEHPLRVKLKVVDPRNFKYTALSYTWDYDHTASDGSDLAGVATQELLCGGTPVRVGQNLYDALSQIRDVQSDVPVFADALCINFANNRERTAYIEIMGHIYARAASVVVWLGKKDRTSDETMLIMRRLVNSIDWRRIQGNANNYDFRDPQFFQHIGMEPLTLKQWRQIHDFCQKRWFTRYWAFFELALAKQALFLWGEACMEYSFLFDFGMILSLSGWLDDLRQKMGEIDGQEESVVGLTKMLGPVARLRSMPLWHPNHNGYRRWMMENYGLQSEEQQAWKFFEILLESSEAFKCRDQRDRVYAPLALARTVFAGKPINKQWPTPDYSRSTEHVLHEFSTLIRQYTGQSSILAPPSRPPPPPQHRQSQVQSQQYRGQNSAPIEDRSRSRGRRLVIVGRGAA